MTFAELSEVWRPLDIGFAVIEGLLFGYIVVGRFAADPTYASGLAEPREIAWITAWSTAAAGFLFFGGQILASFLGHDASWTRVVSRYGIWVVFSVAVGIGIFVRLVRHMRRKHAEVHDQAVSERADEA